MTNPPSTPTPPTDSQRDALLAALLGIVSAAELKTSGEDRDFYSSDVYSSGARAACVVTPVSVDVLQSVVRVCTSLGYAVIARGGGLSYSSGYLPERSQSVILDLSALTRIVEINETDMYVTVESGCTWHALYVALQRRGLRTPYFGPMSGLLSTVGGALSQGSVFLGSTQYGTSSESALSLDVVLADGSLLSTGSASGRTRPSPFFRTYGPDLTGLFLGDSGALGIKVRATLQLLPFPPESRFLSFSYTTAEHMLDALAGISRSSLAAECFGTDPYVQSRRIHEQNLAKDFGYLKAVAQSEPTMLAGLGAAARMVWKGRRSLGGEAFVLNVVIDAASPQAADANMAIVRGLGAQHGQEFEPTIPRAIRSLPFTYPNDILGDRGERWVPTHALAPHSRALEVIRAVEAYFDAREELLKTHGIEWGYLVFAVSLRTTLIEPLFYWPDQRSAYHERMIQPQHLARLRTFAANPEASAAVEVLRTGLIELFGELGCAHLQIGKAYPFLTQRQPAARSLLESIKRAVDPGRLMNPGALGF
jgi:FAD/FMN-containing dehydrogenase